MIVAIVAAVGIVGVAAALVGAAGALAASVGARLTGGAAIDGRLRPVGVVVVVEVLMFLNAGGAAVVRMPIAIFMELAHAAVVKLAPFHEPMAGAVAIAVVRAVVVALVVVGFIHDGRRRLIDILDALVAGVISDFAAGEPERRGTHRGQ